MVLLADACESPREWGLGMSKSLDCCCVVKEALDRLVLLRQCGQSHVPVPSFLWCFYKITQDCFAGVFPLCCSHAFLRCLLLRDTQARICAGRKRLNNLLWRCQIPRSHLGVPTSHWSLPLYGSSCHYFAVGVGEEPISFTAKPKMGENSFAKDKGQVRRMVAEASGCS